jgi:hypothetical protein
MARSDQQLSPPAPPEAAGRHPRHASGHTRLRRWWHRHRRQRLQDYQAPKVARWPRLVRGLGVLLLVVGSILVYLVAWQLITATVSDDVNPDARARQVHQSAPAAPLQRPS